MSEEAKSSSSTMDRDQLYHNLELRYMTLQQVRGQHHSLQSSPACMAD